MKILSIESSCDETAVAVVERLTNGGVLVRKNVVASSLTLQSEFGGIVPEVAAREQVLAMIPTLSEAVKDIKRDEIEGIAVSYGPGLMGSLLIGVETAKTLAWVWNKPLFRVNHMSAHFAANWIVDENISKIPTLPAIGLVVSGGHTDLVLLKSVEEWQWIGGTRDDAVGEAFDKVGRLLGLSYPGGPAIEIESKKIDEGLIKKITIGKLPRPMIYEDNLEMSFSGLKAAVAKMVTEKKMTEEIRASIAHEFNEAVVEVLIKKTEMAREKYSVENVVLAGGVAANKMLREGLINKFGLENVWVPQIKYCGDNAAMVGAAAIIKPEMVDVKDLRPDPNLEVVTE